MIALAVLLAAGFLCALFPVVVLTLDLLRTVHEDRTNKKAPRQLPCQGAYHLPLKRSARR